MRAEVTFAEVVAAVRELVAESDGEIEGYRIYHEARTVLDIDASQSSPALRKSWAKFISQVARALGKLAGEDVLVKIGAGARGPDGTYAPGAEVRWYTREGWEKARARARDWEGAEQRKAMRWTSIRENLAAAGIIPGSARSDEPRLTQDQWETLLARLEG